MRVRLRVLWATLLLSGLLLHGSFCVAAETKRPVVTSGVKRTPASTSPAQSGKPIQDKWAIVIGINKFADKRIPTLKYAAKDAEDFARFLVEKENFAKDHVLLLTNENATEDAILDAVGDNWLPRRAMPDDLILVYVSSHGSPREVDVADENFLVAHDTKVDRLFSSGIKLEDLAPTIKKRTRCGRIVLILDACNSGAADVTSKGLVRNLNFDIDSFAGEGLIVISSSQADERSWESARYPNGVFTKCLMDALQSGGSGTTLSKAFSLLEESVQQEVRFDRKAFQRPLMKSKWVGSELALGVLPTRPRKIDIRTAGSEPMILETVPVSSSEQVASASGISTPSIPTGSATQIGSQRPWLGVMLTGMVPELAKELSVPSNTSGALIREITPLSGAANSNLQIGDIIQTINGQNITSAEDVKKITQARNVGDAINIGVLRQGSVKAIGVVLTASPGDQVLATMDSAAQQGRSGLNSNSQFQSDNNVFPEKVVVLPFSPPKTFELTRANEYLHNFTQQDRDVMASFPLKMWQQVITDMSSQLPAGSVVPALVVRDLTLAAKGLQFDNNNALRASSQLGRAMGARYVVVTKIDKFAFAARAMLTNEYTIRMTTMVLDCQQAKIVATVPTICIKSPWAKDRNALFTDYFERIVIPDCCKKLAQDIAFKIPLR